MRFSANSVRTISGQVVFGVVLLSAATLSSCKGKEKPKEEPARPVKLMKLTDPGLYMELSYPATVRAFQEADLSFLVSGRLMEITVRRGESVKKGQVLAKLDPRDYENEYGAARAYAQEREVYSRRVAEAHSKGAATDAEYDEAVRSAEVAEARMRIAEKALSDTVLLAPFDGEIGRQLKENFQDVAAKEMVFHLQDVSQLKIVVDIPESIRMLTRKAERRKAEGDPRAVRTHAKFDDLPGRRFPVEFYEDEQTADPLTKTYASTFVMGAPTDILLLPGMSATLEGRISIETPQDRPAFYVPVTAVVSGPDTSRYVWVQDPDTGCVAKRQVKVAALAGEDIAVLEGLQVGETIATSGAHYLREGMMVRPLVYKARRQEG